MSETDAKVLIYMTMESPEEAREIAAALIGERLVACANMIDGMTSIFHLEGQVQEDAEAVLIVKTRDDLVDRLVERVRAVHSYDCPCVVALPVRGGNPAFLDWIAAETAGP